MSLLSKVHKGPKLRPDFILLYGVGGVGKSTFAASAPKPIFTGLDDGVAELDVASFIPADWSQLKAFLTDLLMEDNEYGTLVIDTANSLEQLIHAFVCKEAGVKTIEQVDGGFGKGYVRAEDQWIEFVRLLKSIRTKMNVLILGHAKIRSADDLTENERFDRYDLKMHERGAALLHEAVDCTLFACFDQELKKAKGAKKSKAYGDGKRVIYTEERPAFRAKNRFCLPYKMELPTWDQFQAQKKQMVATATEDELLTLFKGVEAEALAYLVNIGWLQEGQELRDLMANKRKPILSRKEDFLKAVKDFAEREESSATPEPATAE